VEKILSNGDLVSNLPHHHVCDTLPSTSPVPHTPVCNPGAHPSATPARRVSWKEAKSQRMQVCILNICCQRKFRNKCSVRALCAFRKQTVCKQTVSCLSQKGCDISGYGGDGALARQRRCGCNGVVTAWGSPVLQVSGHNATACPWYLRVEPHGHRVLRRSNSHFGIYGFGLSHLWGS